MAKTVKSFCNDFDTSFFTHLLDHVFRGGLSDVRETSWQGPATGNALFHKQDVIAFYNNSTHIDSGCGIRISIRSKLCNLLNRCIE